MDNVEKQLEKYKNRVKKGKINSLYNILFIILIYIVLYFSVLSEGPFGYKQGLYINIMIFIIFALSLNIVVGVMGQLNLGHAGFIAIGAYTGAFITKILISKGLNSNLTLIIALILGGLISSIFGFLVSYTTLRLKGDYLAIITLAFGEIVKYIIQNLSFLGGAAGLKNIPDILTFTKVYIISFIIIVLMILILISRFGRSFLSIRENEIAAENIGYDTNKVKIYGFIMSAFFAGMGGVLYSLSLGIITPDKFNFVFSIEILVIVVFGGLGSITGSISSAIFITVINEVLRKTSEYRILIYSIILILLMIYRPTGLLGKKELDFSKIYNSIKNILSRRKEK